MIAVIDCGTTNTRVFILDHQDEIIAQSSIKAGVKDTVITGSTNFLKNSIKEAFFAALHSKDLTLADIEFAVAAGMITSEIGLIEIPHLVAPVGLDELSRNIKVVEDPDVWPIDVPVYFIPGVRNNYRHQATLRDIRQMDFMRGEEVQVMGILEQLHPALPVNIVVLSSHTKLIQVDENAKIAGSITTISGQFYEAMVKETIVGKCIQETATPPATKYTQAEILDIAYDCIEHAGLLRTILMPRFMQVLIETNFKERQSFVDAAIAAEDAKIFEEFGRFGHRTDVEYLLYGQETRCEVYTAMLKKKMGANLCIRSISHPDEISRMTIKGMTAVARRCNII